MKKKLFAAAAALSLAVAVLAQAPAAPAPKTEKEREALVKVQQAADPEARIQAIDYVLENFVDTQFKPILLVMAVDAAQQAHDFEKTVIYGERALEVVPNDYRVKLTLATAIAHHTREFDLDKDKQLAKVDKYANATLEALKTADAPPPGMDVPAGQWPDAKKQLAAEAYIALSDASIIRKDYPAAIATLKTAYEDEPDPSIDVRLAAAYNGANQPDAALAEANKVLAMPNVQPVVKQFAEQEKAKAEAAKARAAK